jgi:ABC-type sugar transport system ATPase subunit
MGLTKSFSGNTVLHGVNLDVKAGQVHALVGENGAGKSTLIKILGGAHKADSGSIFVNGSLVRISSPQDAYDNGIVVIHQELSLAPHLSAEENIFLGHFPRTAFGLVDHRCVARETRSLLDKLEIDVDPKIPVGRLSIAQQQMIEIAKAISFDARVLILDEPTAVLDKERSETLFKLIGRLAADGYGIVFISHHLDEVFRIADHVTVLRDGHVTGETPTAGVDQDWLVSRMIGRKYEPHTLKARSYGKPALSLKSLTSKGAFADITFDVAEGEIVALAGLVGAGRSEVGEAIYGIRPITGGEISYFGSQRNLSGPREASAVGVAYVSEDRKTLGLLSNRPVRENATITALPRFKKFGVLSTALEQRYLDNAISYLDIRLSSPEAHIRTLSGGNQQKVLLSRAMATNPRLIVFDEPTRGVDIGAKRQIYQYIETLAEEGVAIVMISSELEEVLRLADRVVVMRQGFVSAILSRANASEEQIMRAASIAD